MHILRVRIVTDIMRTARGVANVKLSPGAVEGASQLLFGERFAAESTQGDWVFGRCVHDGFPGYMHRDALDNCLDPPTHTVAAMWTPVLRAASLAAEPRDFLCLGSRVSILEQRYQLGRIGEEAWIYKAHVVEGELLQPDYVETAKRFLGVPFVWGGRSTYGFDCTGMIQVALGLAGITAPRDTPEQLEALGQPVESPRRGDLFYLERAEGIFHAGLFVSETHVINAGEPSVAVSMQEFGEVYHLYRLREEFNGALDRYKVHLRRLPQMENSHAASTAASDAGANLQVDRLVPR